MRDGAGAGLNDCTGACMTESERWCWGAGGSEDGSDVLVRAKDAKLGPCFVRLSGVVAADVEAEEGESCVVDRVSVGGASGAWVVVVAMVYLSRST